ncbi:MAG: TatD family hydrolase, partial [Verrucomicrobiales bacterium]
TPDDFESLLTPHLDDPKVAALGETGLDYFHPAPAGWTEASYHERQRDFLRRHFTLAARHGLNIVIHTRDRHGSASFDDALAIYADFKDELRAVFHCFPGPPELAARVFELGGFISFTGIVTFKNAPAVQESARLCPADRFMLETDAPYLAPVPHRGERNEPAHTRLTAEKIAALRATPLSELLATCEKTTRSFFRLPDAEKIE